MGSKFIVVNNGMTGLRGHYFETGMSIAREAQKRSFHTAMATHITCPEGTLPPGLDFYPLFRVDHWGAKVETEAPGLYGLRAGFSALRETTIDDVLGGRASMEEYLLSRFEPPVEVFTKTSPVAEQTATSRRARIKATAKRITPPFAAYPLRWLVRNRHRGKQLIQGFLPPFLYDIVKRSLRKLLQPVVALADSTRSACIQAESVSYDAQVEACLKNALSRNASAREAELWPVFLRDTDRLLCLADARPDDHIYLPTAHGREAYAIRRLIQEIGEERSPTFHLEFRHAIATLDELDSGAQDPDVLSYTRIHQAYFDACRAYPDTARMRFYTDTDELAVDYCRLAGGPFQVLPIPFRAELIPQPSEPRPSDGPLNVLFLGDVREEKGFPLLPRLVEALFENYVKAGRVRFIIQAGIHVDEPSQVLRHAVLELEKYGREHVELVGREGFLAPDEYYALLANSDVVLCPYSADCYRARSSGILAEAIVAGKPTVVREGTWLARQQPSGSGERFTDLRSLVEAVSSVCERYPDYAAGAARVRERWQQSHSPAQLVDRLLASRAPTRAQAA